MSDDCRCDGCGKRGRRRMFTLAPADWFYAEFAIDDATEHYVVLACSEACKLSVWKPGPGKIISLTEEELDSLSPRQIEDDVWRIFNGVKEDYLPGHQYDSKDEAWEAISAILHRRYV